MPPESELQKLKKRVEELEKAAQPPKPFVPEPWQPVDRTAGMSMPRSAMLEMMRAVPGSVMADLRADARKPNPVTGGPPAPPAPQGPRGTGWRDEAPLETPGGISTQKRIGELVDAQDRIDKAELAMRLAKAEVAMEHTKGSTDDDAGR